MYGLEWNYEKWNLSLHCWCSLSSNINHDYNCSHKHYTVLHGSRLVLRCGVDANPSAHAYNLYFNGNFIGSSSSGVLNISVKEDGEYTCVPVNKWGIWSNGSVRLNVVVSPVAEVTFFKLAQLRKVETLPKSLTAVVFLLYLLSGLKLEPQRFCSQTRDTR